MMVAGRIEPPFPSALLAGVAGPTLIMIGSADAVVDRTHLPALAAAMPGCALKVIPSAKHELLFEAAVHRDQAVGAMLAFLADSGNDRQRNSGSWGGIARGVKHAEPDVSQGAHNDSIGTVVGWVVWLVVAACVAHTVIFPLVVESLLPGGA
jgi:hypothetical protein